jgi:hypothetical protein
MYAAFRLAAPLPRRRVLCALLAVALTGCENLSTSLERDPDSVPRAEILEFTRAGGSLPLLANGVAVDTLIAIIPRDANPRLVTFSTTAGTFPLTGNAKEIKVRAEYEPTYQKDKLVARAVLRSDTVPGKATVSAAVGDFKEYREIEFVHG